MVLRVPILTSSLPTLNSAGAAAANAAAASFAALVEKLAYLSPADVDWVRRAYRFADHAHLGQLRASGEPYITHPIAVAQQCALWRLDAQALMAALLHDALEDCSVSKPELIEHFGPQVTELVDGLTKLVKLDSMSREHNQAESFRKMLLATARDVRVILIKLADRSHNMRTLGNVPPQKRRRVAIETLDIYAPIAHRLGLNQTYHELQELAFAHLYPLRHAVLTKAVAKARGRRLDLLHKVQRDVELAFQTMGMAAQVTGREKSLYSIYRKMNRKHQRFAEVSDIYGFRLIVPSTTDCYTALGVLHQMYKPVPGRFKDHVAIAKPNGYQSLHTTAIGPSGVTIEFQVRTEAMHRVAECGIAANWLYKTGEELQGSAERLNNQWLESLLDIQAETHDTTEFWDYVKFDLFPDAVYVVTPKGKILALPRGATVVDFAYAIHSVVGDRALGARINGQPAALEAVLKNGDSVEVLTASTARPNPAWLDFVHTGRARSKIRHHLKGAAYEQSQSLGEQLLAQAMQAEGVARVPDETEQPHLWDKLLHFTGSRSRIELLVDLGLGKRIASIVAKRMVHLLADTGIRPDPLLITQARYAGQDALVQRAVLLDGGESASVQYAPCCQPVPGDAIVGYLGHGEGLSVHRQSCPIAERLQRKDGERFLRVEWSDEPVRAFESQVIVKVRNGTGVLARVTTVFAEANLDIVHVGMQTERARDATELRFVLQVRDQTQLDSVLLSLRRLAIVIEAARFVP